MSMSAVDHASASAEQLQGHGRMMRLLEAYMYDNDASEWEQPQAVLNAHNALSYLKHFSMIAANYTPETELKNIAVRQGWVKSE